MEMKPVRVVLLSFIVVFILINSIHQWPLFRYSVKIILSKKDVYIGHEFLPLKPLLKDIPIAGYLSCVVSEDPLTDPRVMGPYQQARFALTPVILDYFHPLDYRYVVLQCPDPSRQREIELQLSGRITFRTRMGIALLERGKR